MMPAKMLRLIDIDPAITAARADLAQSFFHVGEGCLGRVHPSMLARVRFSAAGMALAPASTSPITNVVGVAVATSPSSSEPSLQILVRKKFEPHRIPDEHMLPTSHAGVAISVVEAGVLSKFQDPMSIVRPLTPGISVGPSGISVAGTLGAVLTDGTKRYVLSNNNVLADENRAGQGTAVWQPGLLDGGVVTDVIGTLSAAPNLSFTNSNQVDCAVAEIDNVPSTNAIPNEVALEAVTPPALGMQVFKYGRTTEKTVGQVTSVHLETDVVYESGSAHFVQQFAITCNDGSAFSDVGDSGAVIRDAATGNAIGLLIGGSPQQSIANDITLVLQSLMQALGVNQLAFA